MPSSVSPKPPERQPVQDASSTASAAAAAALLRSTTTLDFLEAAQDLLGVFDVADGALASRIDEQYTPPHDQCVLHVFVAEVALAGFVERFDLGLQARAHVLEPLAGRDVARVHAQCGLVLLDRPVQIAFLFGLRRRAEV